MQLPSSQVLSRRDLSALRPFGHRLDESPPLWYSVLKEAQVVEEGPVSRAGRRRQRRGSHPRAAAARSGCLSGGRAAVAPDAADSEWACHRRLHDGRLSHLGWCRSRQSRPVGTGGPSCWLHPRALPGVPAGDAWALIRKVPLSVVSHCHYATVMPGLRSNGTEHWNRDITLLRTEGCQR
jgi:hypothetical protein